MGPFSVVGASMAIGAWAKGVAKALEFAVISAGIITPPTIGATNLFKIDTVLTPSRKGPFPPL